MLIATFVASVLVARLLDLVATVTESILARYDFATFHNVSPLATWRK